MRHPDPVEIIFAAGFAIALTCLGIALILTIVLT